MNKLKFLVAMTAIFAFSGQAYAKPVTPVPAWVSIAPTTSPITINWINGNNTGTSTVTYSPIAASIWAYDGNLGSQSAASVQSLIDSKFGLNTAQVSALKFVSEGDLTSGTSGTFTSPAAFDYLAVHYGNGELLFKFSTLQTSLTISGLNNGLSNYRAYSDLLSTTSISPVPEADTYGMMLTGLGLLGFMVRRRKQT